MTLTLAVLVFVTLQRLGELVIARRNTSALLARGAYEVAADHYGLVVGVHTAWLAGLWWLAPGQPAHLIWLAMFALLQLGRVWVLATLGERWTTRIIILPGAPLIASGPYRFFSHPNYAVVVGEIAVLPLAFGLPVYAAIFTMLNAGILTIRITAENAALAAAQSRATHGGTR